MPGHSYDANPCHPPVGGTVAVGWDVGVDGLPGGRCTLAIDGPAALAWNEVADAVAGRLHAAGRPVRVCDVRDQYVPWAVFLDRTPGGDLNDDPDFARLSTAGVDALFDGRPAAPVPEPGGVTVVHGPGSALVEHDVLWYVDLPKRFAESGLGSLAARDLGARTQDPPATSRRLFYVDWPVLDRHRDGLLPHVDRWFDVQGERGDPADAVDRVTSVSGTVLRDSAARLAHRPFRTRPVFNTTPWGGHWAQRELGMSPDAENTALGYELIAPESGVLLGSPAGPTVEIPFAAVVVLFPVQLLGPRVHETFGTSFPIRFDYLDTSGGGNLSVHCHPQSDYMRKVFGWPYTQHETYYVVYTAPERKVYLGLRANTDIEEFRARAHDADTAGTPVDIEQFVQTFPARLHQLFLIPAGTPHGSGEGNVVLEVSATPYLYSLRFYDWLRRGSTGSRRPVHVEHAFANLDSARRGEAVGRDLVGAPQVLRAGPGWSEELLGALPEMFYEVHRLRLHGGVAPCDTNGRFRVMTVVDGAGVVLTGPDGPRELSYAETLVVPAAVGRFSVEARGGSAMVVTAVVR